MELASDFAENAEILLGEYASQLETEPIVQGFLTTAKMASSSLTDTVFSDLKSLVDQLWGSKGWYEEEHMSSIIATICDFFNDFAVYVTEHFMNKLALDVLERLVVTYLKAFFTSKLKIDKDRTVKKMDADLLSIEGSFKQYMRMKYIQKTCQAVTDVKELCDCDSAMFCLHFEFLCKNNPDAGIEVASCLLRMRPDIDKKNAKATIEACTKMQEKEGLGGAAETADDGHGVSAAQAAASRGGRRGDRRGGISANQVALAAAASKSGGYNGIFAKLSLKYAGADADSYCSNNDATEVDTGAQGETLAEPTGLAKFQAMACPCLGSGEPME